MSATAQLEQRLGATQIELRKLGSERHTLRARLRRETDRRLELESALRAEKELRRHASEDHVTALAGLRARLAEVDAASERDLAERLEAEAERELELATLRADLAQAQAELEGAKGELQSAHHAATTAAGVRATDQVTAPARAPKVVQGLRRIRGIGPAYQRVLEQLGVTRVEHIAAWTPSDVAKFAERLKIKPERIAKDDWVGQARGLDPDGD